MGDGLVPWRVPGTLKLTFASLHLKMDGWNIFSFPFGAFRPIFRGELLVPWRVYWQFKVDEMCRMTPQKVEGQVESCVGVYICVCVYIYISIFTRTPRTNIFAPVNWPKPKRKGSYSNHPFSGVMLVLGGVYIYIYMYRLTV